jgi:DNA-binding ferritin-like protein
MLRVSHAALNVRRAVALVVDLIAELIRAPGFSALGAYLVCARLSSIQEEEEVPGADDMIKKLVQGQEAVIRTARGLFPLLGTVSDEPTAQLLTQCIQASGCYARCWTAADGGAGLSSGW